MERSRLPSCGIILNGVENKRYVWFARSLVCLLSFLLSFVFGSFLKDLLFSWFLFFHFLLSSPSQIHQSSFHSRFFSCFLLFCFLSPFLYVFFSSLLPQADIPKNPQWGRFTEIADSAHCVRLSLSPPPLSSSFFLSLSSLSLSVRPFLFFPSLHPSIFSSASG